MKQKHKMESTSINNKEVISESKPTYKDPDVDISFRSKPLTDDDRKEISEFIAKRKKQLQKMGKLASA